MPVPTEKHYVWIKFPVQENKTPGNKFLARILEHYTTSPNRNNFRNYQLLCKTIFLSYDGSSQDVKYSVLQQFYFKNGQPISLDDNVLEIKHKLWDGIETLNIVCVGLSTQKDISFERYNGGRRIRYGSSS